MLVSNNEDFFIALIFIENYCQKLQQLVKKLFIQENKIYVTNKKNLRQFVKTKTKSKFFILNYFILSKYDVTLIFYSKNFFFTFT